VSRKYLAIMIGLRCKSLKNKLWKLQLQSPLNYKYEFVSLTVCQ